MSWHWEATLACGHTIHGEGQEQAPSPGQSWHCPQHGETAVESERGRNW